MVLFMDWGYFVHQSTQKRRERDCEGERGKSAAGHLIVIVSPRSRGSAYASLFTLFFRFPSSVSSFLAGNINENSIDIRL